MCILLKKIKRVILFKNDDHCEKSKKVINICNAEINDFRFIAPESKLKVTYSNVNNCLPKCQIQ